MTTQFRTDANNLAGAISFRGTDNITLKTTGPELLGVPKAPTAVTGDSTTQIATTAFVAATVAAAGGVVASTTLPLISQNPPAIGTSLTYARSDHVHPPQIASQTGFTPSGTVTATNVQNAIGSLDTTKLATSGGTIAGNLSISGTLGVNGQTTHNFGIALNQATGYNSNSINFNAPAMADAGVIYGTHVPGQWAGITLQAQGANAVYSFRNSGNAYAPVGWQVSSDERLKSNIQVVPDALAKLSKLRGCTFTRNDQDNRACAGVIAQDVQAVLPVGVSVFDSANEYMAVDSMAVIAILIEAAKELSREVATLRSRVYGSGLYGSY